MTETLEIIESARDRMKRIRKTINALEITQNEQVSLIDDVAQYGLEQYIEGLSEARRIFQKTDSLNKEFKLSDLEI